MRKDRKNTTVLPKEMLLSFSIGTFLTNYDVTCSKLNTRYYTPLYGNNQKWAWNKSMETTTITPLSKTKWSVTYVQQLRYLFTMKWLVKTQLMISSNDNLVLVRLRLEPGVEFSNFWKMSASSEVTGVDQDVAVGKFLSHVWRHSVGVAYANDSEIMITNLNLLLGSEYRTYPFWIDWM